MAQNQLPQRLANVWAQRLNMRFRPWISNVLSSCRRSFRCLVALASFGMLSGCASLSTSPVPVSENTVYCPPLRLNVTKPVNWSFVPLREVRAAQKAFKSTNAELNSRVYNDAVAPFVTMVRNESSTAKHQPVVTIIRESLGEDRLATSERVLRIILGNEKHLITGARPVGTIYTVRIAGMEFSHLRVRSPLRFRDGTAVEVEQRFWVRAHGLSVVVIRAAYDIQDMLEVEPELEQIIRSIDRAEPPVL